MSREKTINGTVVPDAIWKIAHIAHPHNGDLRAGYAQGFADAAAGFEASIAKHLDQSAEFQIGKGLAKAAAVLPEGYIVVVSVEKDAGWAQLETPAGEIVGSDAETLPEEIEWCIAYAIEDIAESGVDAKRGQP